MTLNRTVFFPYPYEGETLSLEVGRVWIDGRERKGFSDPERRLVSLHELPGWREGSLEVSCRPPPGLAQRTLPANEWEAPGWRCDVIGLCGPTRWRLPFRLDGPPEGPWTGKVHLRRDALQGVARLTAQLTRARDTTRRGPFASRMGAKLASAPDWQLRIDDPRMSAGKYLRIRWEDFAKSELGVLQQNDHQIYFLEIEGEGGGPILWLNSGVEDLQTVLDSKASSGPRAATRNALFDSIAQPVWLALVMRAARKFAEREEDDAGEPFESEGGGWEESVLATIAEEVFPDEESEKAVSDLAQGLSDPEQQVDLLQRVSLAVQRHLVLQKSTVALLRALEAAG